MTIFVSPGPKLLSALCFAAAVVAVAVVSLMVANIVATAIE